MLSALDSVLSIILMIVVGFVLAKRGWFDEAASALITRLVVSLSLPAYMISNLMGGYDSRLPTSLKPREPALAQTSTPGTRLLATMEPEVSTSRTRSRSPAGAWTR